MEQHFALFKNFLLFKEQEKISLAKHTLLLISNLDLSITRFIGSSDPSNVLLIWLIKNLLQAQGDEIQKIKLSFSSPDHWTNIKNPPKTGKDPSIINKQHVDDIVIDTPVSYLVTPYVNNYNNNSTITRSSYSRGHTHIQKNLTPTEDQVPTPMQDVILLESINVFSNSTSIPINDDNQSPPDVFAQPTMSAILMNTSSSNDTLIKKVYNKKKKKLRQEPEKVDPTEVVPTNVLIDILIDVSEYVSETPERLSFNKIISAHPISIPKEIMDITFNEIVNESIDMIIDQLDSTHLSTPLPNPLKDQLSTRYQALLSSTGILDKSHSFTPSHNSSSQIDTSICSLSFDARVAVQRAQVTIKKDSCIKNIKAIKHKKEYLKKYTYDGFIVVEDIKSDSSINNHEELLAFIELFMRQIDHFTSVNYCSTESVPSVIVKFSKHEGLIKAANYFKHGHHTGRMKLILKTYYRIGRDKVSCREFKIINVPIDMDLLDVEQAIRSILKAYFKKSDIELRNTHVRKFSGFSPTHDLNLRQNLTSSMLVALTFSSINLKSKGYPEIPTGLTETQKDPSLNNSKELLINPWISPNIETSTSEHNDSHNDSHNLHINTIQDAAQGVALMEQINEGCGSTSSDHNFSLPITSGGHIINAAININKSQSQDSTLYPTIQQPQLTENYTHIDSVDSFV
ncbi:hypothetical protein C1645_836539 [Glomus cerebriforme]|uniref:Uncharacterized protein n=1 Tax=Glomus cerebriforme TaxID=658196 RepID=A0A397SGZ4_9GLOM|nr:hypothetical protein C1645_836539 [Glomus cerebriforme]